MVSLEASRGTAGDLIIEVRDTGVGIAESEIERVLRPFEQSERA